ncbi:insulinase family protein [Candidatus Dojkabacteria bacterium]|nr:insulinase family protein [Candidatus Dojkabacteria bacterium]
MKILNSWRDERYGAENTLYELPNGTKLLHSLDPKTVDSIFSIYTRIGSLYNPILKVKGGTAHFLEHILAGNPNETFKTKKQIDNFEFGSKRYPKIFSNAWTNRLGMAFHGTANSEGEARLLKRVASFLNFKSETFSKYIEKERKIILAELGQKDKPEKNAFLQFCSFAFKDLNLEYQKYALGTEEDIKEITAKDLSTFYSYLFNNKSTILSLQSSKPISKKSLRYITEMDSYISKIEKTPERAPSETLINKFMYMHFKDEKASNIGFELETFDKDSLKTDYKQKATRMLSYNLVNHIIFEDLREKKGYVYSSDTFYEGNLLASHNIRGMYFSTSIENFKKAVDSFYKIITEGAGRYLNSRSGKKWLESQISGVLFPNTSAFDDDYARGKATSYIGGYDIYDYTKFKAAALKVTPGEIESYIKESILNTPHIVWITSDKEDKKIEDLFRKTKLFKYQSSLSPSVPL